jgi:hypothetical protein
MPTCVVSPARRVARVQQEGRDQLDQLRFGRAEQQQEGQHRTMSRRRKKDTNTRRKAGPQGLPARQRQVGTGRGKQVQVPQAPAARTARQQPEHRCQASHHAARRVGQVAGQVHQPALATDHRHAVEQAAHADEGGLLVLRQASR